MVAQEVFGEISGHFFSNAEIKKIFSSFTSQARVNLAALNDPMGPATMTFGENRSIAMSSIGSEMAHMRPEYVAGMLEANDIELSEEGWQRLAEGFGGQDFGKGIDWLKNIDAPSLNDRKMDLAKRMAIAAIDYDSIKASKTIAGTPGGRVRDGLIAGLVEYLLRANDTAMVEEWIAEIEDRELADGLLRTHRMLEKGRLSPHEGESKPGGHQ